MKYHLDFFFWVDFKGVCFKKEAILSCGMLLICDGFGPCQVIYIAVTDFFQKKEREKFEKEEAAKEKNSGKKGKIRTRGRAAPRGFGQKIEEADIDERVT